MIGRLVLLAAGVVAAAAGAAALARKRAEREAPGGERPWEATAAYSTGADSVDDASRGQDGASGGDGASDGDELQVLKGIGKVSEERLRDIGITTFAQIAAWSSEELEDVAAQIKVSPQRIRREDWVGQAQSATDIAS